MKKITFIIDSLDAGGSERILSELSNYLSLKYEIIIITINQKKNHKDFYFLKKKIRRINIYQNLKRQNIIIRVYKIYKIIKRLRGHLKIEKPLATISFLTFSNLINILSSIGLHHKRFISERMNPKYINRSIIYKLLTYLLYRFSQGLIVQSNEIMSRFKFYGVKQSKIYNHVREFKKKLRNDKLSFLNISRLDSQKNIFFLIKVFENLIRINSNITLKIIGGGELEYKLKNYIKVKNLSNNIKMLGIKKNVDQFLMKNNYYIHTSETEGMSNSIIEALSANAKCIIKKTSSQHEIFKNKKNCFVINQEDTKKFSEEINNIIKLNKKISDKILFNAKLTTKKLNIKNISKKWEKLLID